MTYIPLTREQMDTPAPMSYEERTQRLAPRATKPQVRYLQALLRDAGENPHIPASLTKAEASTMIDNLKRTLGS